jgi:hypothetical protein
VSKKQVFPWPDAQLAVDINTLRDQLLSLRVRASDRLKPDTVVIGYLDIAHNALGDAMEAALTIKKEQS